MKLRNKKTRKIIETHPDRFVINSGEQIMHYNSLAELNENWEDYEEFWYISDFGYVISHAINNKSVKSTIEEMKSIGNYFETKEEAEQTVEKLKAWKRLRDKGLKSFSSDICGDDFVVNFKLTNHVDYSQSIDDFDCIFDFGGEE